MSIGNKIVTKLPDLGEVSDGYHTFNELYEHRIELFLALCRHCTMRSVWKSRLHSDGTSIDGWFILGIGTAKGDQITYHLPNAYWDHAGFIALDRAPEFDGHTSADVIKRLKAL